MMGMDDKLSGPLIVCMLTLHAASGRARLQCFGGGGATEFEFFFQRGAKDA
jgi:hypothetical protein